jgi:hypothetical protein
VVCRDNGPKSSGYDGFTGKMSRRDHRRCSFAAANPARVLQRPLADDAEQKNRFFQTTFASL